MTYRDNEVDFSAGAGYSLVSGTYTVYDFSITDGQDPDKHIYPGLVTNCGSDGKFVFSIGRKSSGEVADWFNIRVAPSQSTFDHRADDLNFALIGELKLTLTGGLLGSRQETFVFINIVLAQGTDGNNWWFGGPSCNYIGDNEVTCAGENSQSAPVAFIFQRGGNGVHNVDITSVLLVDTANWMKGLSDSLKLNGIMMPGSHDAGMSVLYHCAPPIGVGGFTQTQSGSIGQQLNDGSRYFDIRVDYDYDELVTYHRTEGGGFGWGCNGQSLADVLNQASAFFAAHPTETAIFKFSHIRDTEDHDPASTKQKINDFLNDYSNVIYTNATGSVNLADITLKDARGKMILVFDYSEYINPATGRFRYMDGSSAQSGANITVYDKYSNTSDYETMKTDQLQKWKDYGGLNKEYLFLLSWTLTANLTSPSVEAMAAEANSNLPGVLYDQIVTAGSGKPNIVYIDYLDSNVTQSIIRYNF